MLRPSVASDGFMFLCRLPNTFASCSGTRRRTAPGSPTPFFSFIEFETQGAHHPKLRAVPHAVPAPGPAPLEILFDTRAIVHDRGPHVRRATWGSQSERAHKADHTTTRQSTHTSPTSGLFVHASPTSGLCTIIHICTDRNFLIWIRASTLHHRISITQKARTRPLRPQAATTLCKVLMTKHIRRELHCTCVLR